MVAIVPGRGLMRDPDAEARLSRDGYVVVDLLTTEEIERLRETYYVGFDGERTAVGVHNDTYAEFTVVHSTPAFRRHAFKQITEIVATRAAEHLESCRPLVANFVNKSPGLGIVPVHQNMSLVDEAEHRSLSVWVALVDCTDANGTLQVVPGSHIALRGRRGMWAYQAFGEIADRIGPYLEVINVRAGQAIVLDDALIHFSPPNRSGDDRLAIQLVVVPREAPALSFEITDDRGDQIEIEALEVSPEYFWNFWDGRGDRAHATSRGAFIIPRLGITEDQLIAALRTGHRLQP